MHGDLLCTDDVAYQAVPCALAESAMAGRISDATAAGALRSRSGARGEQGAPVGRRRPGTMEAITESPVTVDTTSRATASHLSTATPIAPRCIA